MNTESIDSLSRMNRLIALSVIAASKQCSAEYQPQVLSKIGTSYNHLYVDLKFFNFTGPIEYASFEALNHVEPETGPITEVCFSINDQSDFQSAALPSTPTSSLQAHCFKVQRSDAIEQKSVSVKVFSKTHYINSTLLLEVNTSNHEFLESREILLTNEGRPIKWIHMKNRGFRTVWDSLIVTSVEYRNSQGRLLRASHPSEVTCFSKYKDRRNWDCFPSPNESPSSIQLCYVWLDISAWKRGCSNFIPQATKPNDIDIRGPVQVVKIIPNITVSTNLGNNCSIDKVYFNIDTPVHSASALYQSVQISKKLLPYKTGAKLCIDISPAAAQRSSSHTKCQAFPYRDTGYVYSKDIVHRKIKFEVSEAECGLEA